MSSFKKLSKADVTTVPYHANKQWLQDYCPYPTSSDFLTIYKGTNVTGSFSLDEDPITEGQYERLIYTQINHLFYQDYTASLNTGSLMFNVNTYQSASQQRPTSSYFIYNNNANLVTAFPTGAMDGIRVLAINQGIYGNEVLPNYFILSSSAYYIKDDGYGNLYDTKSTKTHVGNLFYAHGLGIITNQDYQLMFPLPPIAKNNSGSFLTTDSPKTISVSLNDYARSGTLNSNSLILSGSTSDLSFWATGSSNTVILTTTVVGTYNIYYTIGADIVGSCATQLRSNKAKISATVTAPPPSPSYIPVSIYTNTQGSYSENANVYYRLNGGSWDLFAPSVEPLSFVNPNYALYSSGISAFPGDTLEIGIKGTSNNNRYFGIGQNSGNYNTYFGQITPYNYGPMGSSVLMYLNLEASASIPATVSWSLSEYTSVLESSFLDANFRIQTVGGGTVYLDQAFSGTGSLTVPIERPIEVYLYSFTNEGNVSNWSTYVSASLSGSITHSGSPMLSGSTPIWKNGGTLDLMFSPITLVSNDTYNIYVRTLNPT